MQDTDTSNGTKKKNFDEATSYLSCPILCRARHAHTIPATNQCRHILSLNRIAHSWLWMFILVLLFVFFLMLNTKNKTSRRANAVPVGSP